MVVAVAPAHIAVAEYTPVAANTAVAACTAAVAYCAVIGYDAVVVLTSAYSAATELLEPDPVSALLVVPVAVFPATLVAVPGLVVVVISAAAAHVVV